MINIKWICILVLSIIIMCTLYSCTNLTDTAKKNMDTANKLPQYELNEGNLKEISMDGKVYVIQESTVSFDDAREPIGKVNKTVTINDNNEILNKEELRKIYIIPRDKDEKRYHLSFGWVYRIEGKDTDEEVAVVINNKYHTAKIKK